MMMNRTENKEKEYVHSSSYHSFFEDWAEKEWFDRSARRHIERVYTGRRYTPALSSKELRQKRRRIGLLYVGAFVLFLTAGLQDSVLNHSRWPGLLNGISLIVIAHLAVYVITFVTAPAKMEVRQYRDCTERFHKNAVTALVCLAALGVAGLVSAITEQTGFLGFGAWILPYGLSWFCLYLLFRLQKEIPYDSEKPAARPAPDSYQIHYYQEF